MASPIAIGEVARSSLAAIAHTDTDLARARLEVSRVFGARSMALTDSGTSALVLALRAAVPPGGTVAYPGYACVDLAAAAAFAGVRVRVYDLDPATLSPDLDSVARVLRRGVDAVVVAHLFGYPADVLSVRRLASAAGAVTIEDAAQGSGGALDGQRLGSLGDLSVLSFGRGKGLCAGGGGALLGFRDSSRAVEAISLPMPTSGLSGSVKTAIQWFLGRPWLYAAPSALPWLHLGEMVYHPATEPVSLTLAANALLGSAIDLEVPELQVRRRIASRLHAAAEAARDAVPVRVISSGEAGFLRWAVRDSTGVRALDSRFGIVRPYPRTLLEQPELTSSLIAGEPETPGAAELRATLFTLPTHRFVNAADLRGMERWLIGRESERAARGREAAAGESERRKNAHVSERVSLTRSYERNFDVTRGRLLR